EQMIGRGELHAAPFQYCGSLVPYPVPAESLNCIRRIGEVLGEGSGARGLFGCDFLFDGNVPWLTEVNPRYPASAELFEFLYRIPLLDWHRRACLAHESSQRSEPFLPDLMDLNEEIETTLRRTFQHVVGKVILYAKRDVKTPSLEHLVS